jgi:AmmeMemoRadiSam system protein A
MIGELSKDDGAALIALARRSIESGLDGLSPLIDEQSLAAAIVRPAGAFVTINESGDLRGCIGSILPAGPLWRAVWDNARHAAFRDPRFSPLTPEEYLRISVEVSVMGPVHETTPAEVVVGRDGLIVRKGPFSGLLLPQVAVEYGWDKETFLSHTCRKAGLPPDAWRAPGCRIEKFSAQVFTEDPVIGVT